MRGDIRTSRPLEVSFPDAGVCLIESHHSDDFRMGWRSYPFFKWIYVLEGAGQLFFKKERHALKPATLCYVPAGMEHRIEDDNGSALSLQILCLEKKVIAGFGEPGLLSRECFVSRHPALAHKVSILLKQMLFEQTTRVRGWGALLTGLSLQMWVLQSRWKDTEQNREDASGARMPSQQRVLACREEAGRTFYQSWTLKQAAAGAGLGVRRFSQLFRQLSGQSWLEFIRNKRIAHAREVLKCTDRSVLSVCFECGFEDLSTFYRSFRQVEGLSPQRWRELHRKRLGRGGRG